MGVAAILHTEQTRFSQDFEKRVECGLVSVLRFLSLFRREQELNHAFGHSSVVLHFIKLLNGVARADICYNDAQLQARLVDCLDIGIPKRCLPDELLKTLPADLIAAVLLAAKVMA